MQILKKIIAEPISQFLLAGAILYIIYTKTVSIIAPNELLINQNDLINFMQFQANDFNKTAFEARYQKLSPSEKQTLLNQYVEDEVLVKEAQKLGLEQNDNVIRKRLIQKMKFILQNEISQEINPTESELKAFYETHTAQYSTNEKYSFTHVFFAFENHSESQALQLTQDFIHKSKNTEISADASLNFSERFPYHNNYIQRNLDFIQSNFGEDFTKNLSKITPSPQTWKGPIKSNLGYHAILFIGKEANNISDFDTVKELVKNDYQHFKEKELLAQKIKQFENKYKITLLNN